MRLIIANCTTQPHDFVYRVPESNREKKQVIPAGGQAYVHDDAPKEVLLGIVAQHEKYGLIDQSKLNRENKFIGLCFSFDGPVSMDEILTADDHNKGVLTDRAMERQLEMASAIRSKIDDDEIGVSSVSVEVVQDDKSAAQTGKKLAKGVEVIEAGETPRRGPNAKRQ